MAGRAQTSNSESEHKPKSSSNQASEKNCTLNTRSGGWKPRFTVAQQQYLKDLINKNIHDNHPDKIPKPHPIDFESYSDDFLRRYKDNSQIQFPDNMSIQGYLLGSKLGTRTYSYKRNHASLPDARITKKQLAEEVKRHFTSYSIKEAECIPLFIYKVKSNQKKFRMEFKG